MCRNERSSNTWKMEKCNFQVIYAFKLTSWLFAPDSITSSWCSSVFYFPVVVKPPVKHLEVRIGNDWNLQRWVSDVTAEPGFSVHVFPSSGTGFHNTYDSCKIIIKGKIQDRATKLSVQLYGIALPQWLL